MKDSESFREAGIRSFLAIPLQDENDSVGFLSLSSWSGATSWPSDIVSRLRLIADILGSALARQHAAQALRESELLKLSLLESMLSSVAIIDHNGFVVEVNQHWLDEGIQHRIALQSEVAIGTNYFDFCRKESNADELTAGIQSVLRGLQAIFEIEYESSTLLERRWYRMTVLRLSRDQGGAVVSHLNITQQKLAEIEEQRMQEQLIVLNRSSELGQLAASLAHELAQPIAASLSNAQAALRLATRPEPDLVEIRGALADVIEDDQRARAVLNSIRSILKKHSVIPHPVNLNEVVDGVIAIVKNNAQLRRVQIRSILAIDDVMIRGDEVPLQQVLLNLVNNAMDSMGHLPFELRILTLKTSIHPQNASALLVVEDEGTGIPDTLKEHLFSPFFTTKSDGLGMGLVICRTILRSLGGSITCQNRPEHGAVFCVELPLAS